METAPAAGLSPILVLIIAILGPGVTAVGAAWVAYINRGPREAKVPASALAEVQRRLDDAERALAVERRHARDRERDLRERERELDVWQQRAYSAGWRSP